MANTLAPGEERPGNRLIDRINGFIEGLPTSDPRRANPYHFEPLNPVPPNNFAQEYPTGAALTHHITTNGTITGNNRVLSEVAQPSPNYPPGSERDLTQRFIDILTPGKIPIRLRNQNLVVVGLTTRFEVGFELNGNEIDLETPDTRDDIAAFTNHIRTITSSMQRELQNLFITSIREARMEEARVIDIATNNRQTPPREPHRMTATEIMATMQAERTNTRLTTHGVSAMMEVEEEPNENTAVDPGGETPVQAPTT